MKYVSFIAVAVIATIACAMSGCASAPTQQQIASADYGSPMTPQDCRLLANIIIADQLKDPNSAEFSNEPPCQKGWVSSVPIMGMKAAFGYVQHGEVNGKNSFGGYVGFRSFMVLMRNGAVVRSCIADKGGICMPSNQYAGVTLSKEDRVNAKAQDQTAKLQATLLRMANDQMDHKAERKESDKTQKTALFHILCQKMEEANASHPNDKEKNAHNEAVLANMRDVLDPSGAYNLHCGSEKSH